MSLAISFGCQPLLALLALYSAHPLPTTTDVEAFLPTDAVFVVRARSIDDLDRFMATFGANETLDVLDLMKTIAKVGGPWDLVDRTKPFLVCTSPAGSGPPILPTIVVHASDAAKLAASEELTKGGFFCRAEGDVVAIAQGRKPEMPEKPSALARGLDAFDVVARIDFTAVKAAFGDQIDAGLEQMDSAAEGQGDEDEVASKTKSVMLGGVHSLVESAEMIEIHASQSGGETLIGFEVRAAEGSAMDGAGSKEKAPIAELARGIDPDAPIAVLSVMDMAGFMDRMKDMLTTIAAKLPEEQKAQILSGFEANGDVYASMGPGFGASFRFGESGMRVSTAMRPKDSAALIAKTIEVLHSSTTSELQVTGPTKVQVDGVDVQQYRAKAAAKDAADAKESKGENKGEGADATKKKTNEAFEQVFGPDGMLLSFAERAGTLMYVVGGNEQSLAHDVARLKAKSYDSAVKPLVDAVAGMNPCFAVQFDLGQLLEGLSAFVQKLGSDEEPESMLDTAKKMRDVGPILISGGIGGRTWRLTISGDAKRLIHAFKGEGKTANPAAKK